MQVYNTTNTENSLVHEAWDLCDADITSYPLAKVIRRFNFALEKLVAEIINADGVWEYDDTNHTTRPIGRGNLEEGRSSYSFSSEYLKVNMVEILNDDGLTYRKLKQLDRRDLGGLTIEEYFGTNSSGTYPNNIAKGMPKYYDIEGDSILLYPAPTSTQVTLTNGIRASFSRTADLFTTSDTTQEPGLPSSFHELLSIYAALRYCALYKKDRVPLLKKDWDDGVKAIVKFFARRNPDRKDVITMNNFEDYR